MEGSRSDGFSDAFAEAFLNGDYFDRLAGMCVEIADGSGRSVFKLHQLASGECLLHPTVRDAGFLNVDVTLWDNVNTLNYRLHTLEYGDQPFHAGGQARRHAPDGGVPPHVERVFRHRLHRP